MTRRLPICAALCVATALGLAISAPVGAEGVTQVSGQATAAGGDGQGECGGKTSLFTLVLEGDLEGCWYTDSIPYIKETPAGIYMERGTESFEGTWNGESVTFSTTYKFTAKFDADFNEIHGRCQHPIAEGDVDGRVDFKDDVETGIYYYRGHLTAL